MKIGIDLGGSHIAIGVVDNNGRIIEKFEKRLKGVEKKKIKEKDVIGMNLKYHGRNINKFYCKKCLMKIYGWDDDKWVDEVNKFKQQGCTLF